jgi:hypothetical protein
MRRALLLASVILAAASFGFAHDNDHSKAASGAATLTGCLSGPNDEGVFVLKTKTSEVEVGGLADLKSHVGHEVKLTGTWASGADIGENEPSKTERDAGAPKTEKGEKHLKVATIQHVSNTCKVTPSK